jgi:hypothetical protein
METEKEGDAKRLAAAKTLYTLVWRHYMLQVECIGRSEYEHMQAVIGYPESYEEHMLSLVEGVPNDPRTFVDKIVSFLRQYPEFEAPRYADYIGRLIENVEANKESHKRKAFETLIALNKDAPKALPSSSLTRTPPHPPLFEIKLLGAGDPIVLPTYGNPMMTALYALLFRLFGLFQTTEVAEEHESSSYF